MASKEKEPLLHSWIITLGRPPTADEFSMCLRVLDTKSYDKITLIPDPDEAWKSLVGRLIPYVLMDQRRAPRTSWSLKETKYGKPYIDHGNDQKTIGYNITHTHNIVGMACAIGQKHKVWNIGIDSMRISPPEDMSVDDFIESLIHKLTPLELSFLDPSHSDEVKLRRLYILWTLKESYTKALGQPIGFDFSRIECDIPHRQIRVDGEPLLGWEFRLFRANTGVLRRGVLLEESYQCTTAIYRGGGATKLLWEHEDGIGESDKWLRAGVYYDIDTPSHLSTIIHLSTLVTITNNIYTLQHVLDFLLSSCFLVLVRTQFGFGNIDSLDRMFDIPVWQLPRV
ncbi:L-aminoadipate-semialdehyde dehydrogenase-phosphopantetheinyl transferase OS=Xenopus laevis GN=aasdhppt PE=2 SV=1 [Rhizoctonia solani AG-1 IB]|uniref:holo-[acyl-carrier-protein] synthase n=1 Tax=Thanatephorus cucumeris (strain AG1-IB / isolate 7/3/14) TaxID=1108050 RepID=A0A0B7FI86_THACB|nr:L-aminoadipate-semialdehyde dehydrogenase-phosphopantetheinyl transferase OS=Xenopus laevis GN=aasdhppt PE=2 SV=1 [Rhizoctonia solani AG-1 IB]